MNRCGVTSLGGAWGCCRPLGHDGAHCAHDTDALTGRPGRIVVGRSWFGVSLGSCDGHQHPAGDRIVGDRRPGRITSRTDLIPPNEGNAS